MGMVEENLHNINNKWLINIEIVNPLDGNSLRGIPRFWVRE